jgi:hypothetical protein
MSINLLKLLTQKQPNHFERFAKAYQFELKEEQRRQARFNNIEGYNRTIEESYMPDLATKIRVEGSRNERFIERPQTPQIFLPQVIPQVLQVPQVLRIYQSPPDSPDDVFLDAPTELPSLILGSPTTRIKETFTEQGTETLDIQNKATLLKETKPSKETIKITTTKRIPKTPISEQFIPTELSPTELSPNSQELLKEFDETSMTPTTPTPPPITTTPKKYRPPSGKVGRYKKKD